MKFYMRISLVLSICILLFFYFFSREVKRGFLKQADFGVTVKLQERIDKSARLRLADALGNVFEGSTFFSGPEASVVFVGLLTIAALVDFKNKKIRLRALGIPLLFGLLVLGEIYGKSVVHHPAPPFFMIKNPTTIFPQFYVNEQYSYPSGHTARAVFLGIVVWLLAKKRRNVAIAVGAYIFLVAIGRIYLGHHWLSDVIGGGLLGSGFGIITLSIY